MAYDKLVTHFAFYGAYHNNKTNQLIHILCVPLILVTALMFLNNVDVTSYISSFMDTSSILQSLTLLNGKITLAIPIAIAYALYYLYLSPSL